MLSTFVRPTIDLVMPDTVPVNVGDAKFALRSSAVCCAVETGFAVSAVLSTLPSPTMDLVIPTVVPPTYKLPPMPAPPETWSAPDAVLVATVVFFMDVIPPTNSCLFIETSPPSLICIILVLSS